MQFPKIGEKFVCNNGTEFTCCNLTNLTPAQQKTAKEYSERGVLGDIIGKAKTNGWMHWNSSIEGGDESFDWKIKKIFREFNPKPGDTIVTAGRGNYICSEIFPNGDFHGKNGDSGWQNWDKNGVAPGHGYPKIEDAYRVVEIIPAVTAVQVQESTLEFKLRVLEKENQILTRLLLKEGKL